jgi:hypothetical protein
MRQGGRIETDMTKLIVSFGKFVKVPKILP